MLELRTPRADVGGVFAEYGHVAIDFAADVEHGQFDVRARREHCRPERNRDTHAEFHGMRMPRRAAFGKPTRDI